jgi:hypothetical protein
MESLSGKYRPEMFLSLVPDAGSLDFFLPLLERSLQQWAADSTYESLKSELARLEETERLM